MLARMVARRPSNTDPDSWFQLAVRMDQNHIANEAFHLSTRTPSMPTSTACPRLVATPRPVPTVRATAATESRNRNEKGLEGDSK